MKLSAPEDVNAEVSRGEHEATSVELPSFDGEIQGRFGLGEQSLESAVGTNGDLVVTLWDRVGDVESRVEELENENAELRDRLGDLESALEETWSVLEAAESVEQFKTDEVDDASP